MMNTEETVYWVKYILYATSFFWVLYLAIFSHELGHAITVLSLGGTLHELVVTWDMRGYVLWSLENVPMESVPQVKTLVGVSGGIGAALFFMILTQKSKWFVVPALFALIDGFSEAMYLAGTRYNATCGVTISALAICMWLFWQFGERENNKRIAKVGKRKSMVPEHIYERAMRALEKCVEKYETEVMK